MKSFLTEYGLLIISIVGVAFFFFVWAMFMSEDRGFGVVYNTWSPNVEALRDSSSVEYDSVRTSRAPYFTVDTSDVNNFILDGNTFTKKDALEHVNAYYNDVELPASRITVLVYRYKPIMSPTDNGNINGHVKLTSDYSYDELMAFHESGNYTEVFATDKYGNYLYDDNGKHIIDEQPIYEISKAKELTDSSYIDVSNVSEKYLVVYRVIGGDGDDDGTLKAECKKFFIKKSTTVGSTDPLEGYEKVDFDSDIDDSVVPLSIEGGDFSLRPSSHGASSSGTSGSPSSNDDKSAIKDTDKDDSDEEGSDEGSSKDSEDSKSDESDSDTTSSDESDSNTTNSDESNSDNDSEDSKSDKSESSSESSDSDDDKNSEDNNDESSSDNSSSNDNENSSSDNESDSSDSNSSSDNSSESSSNSDSDDKSSDSETN